MPRKTIKSLEERIQELRELRQGDRETLISARNEVEKFKERVAARGLEIEELRRDRAWLRALVQNLVPGRNPNA